MESLRTKKAYQYVNTYIKDQIFEDGSTEVKLGYLNINSLLNKVEDIDEDKNLLGLDILMLSETRLSKEMQVNFKNWKISRFDFEDKKSKAPHLGLALLSKETSKTQIGTKSSVIKLSENIFFQYLEVHLKTFGVKGIMFYVNKKPSNKDMKSIIKHFKDHKLNFFIGDLNLNATDVEDRKRISLLTNGLKMKNILHQHTRMKTHIDHVMISEKFNLTTYATSFSNLYSDHAAVTLRICFDGKFTSEFVQDQLRKQDLNYLVHQDPVTNQEKAKHESILIAEDKRMEGENICEGDVLLKGRNFILYASELERLNPPRFLSDEIMNSYCHLISEKYKNFFFFDSFFHKTLEENGFNEQRSYVNQNPCQSKIWLMPINFQNCHWILLCINVEDLQCGQVRIDLYDSASEMNFTYDIKTTELIKYIRFMYKKYQGLSVGDLHIMLQNQSSNIPQQENGYDCGAYVLAYAMSLVTKESMCFNQTRINKFRQNLRHEFRRKQLNEVCVLYGQTSQYEQTGQKTTQKNIGLVKARKRSAVKDLKQPTAKRIENEEIKIDSEYDQSPNSPIGLLNLGNTCYFNALIQSLHSLRLFSNAIVLDTLNIGNENILASKMAKLFSGLDAKMPLDNLRKLTLDVLGAIQERVQGEFQLGYQSDPQELLFYTKMILNENQRRLHHISTLRNYPSLKETIENYEYCNPSNTTKLTTIYTKAIKRYHERESCMTETYDRLSSLVVRFKEDELNANEKEIMTVEALITNYMDKTKHEERVKCPICSLPNVCMTEENFLSHLPPVFVVTIGR